MKSVSFMYPLMIAEDMNDKSWSVRRVWLSYISLNIYLAAKETRKLVMFKLIENKIC